MYKRVPMGLAALAAAFVTSIASGQDVDLSQGGSEAAWRGTAPGAQAGFYFDLGPLNRGDARRDLVVGAPGRGEVYLVFGGRLRSGEINLGTEDAVVRSTVTGDQFGYATAAGHVISLPTSETRDLIVGAPQALGGRGAVFVFRGGFGHGDRIDTRSAVAQIIGRPGELLGSALATIDLNGDGYREMVMGAPGAGRVHVIFGGPTLAGVVDLNVVTPSITVSGAGIGGVLDASDVTGDGITELLFGAPSLDTVYVLKGRSSGGFPGAISLPAGADIQFTATRPGDRAGHRVATEDVDNDGIRDIIIAAPAAPGPGGTRPGGGEAYLIWGASNLSTRSLAAADVTFYGAAGARLGEVVSVGHINRDSRCDLLFVAPGATTDASEVYIYYGRGRSQIGTLRSDGRRAVDMAAGDYSRRILGSSTVGAIGAAVAFEMTGEGARDIVLGTPGWNNSTGAAYVTLSPRMELERSSLTLTAGEGATATATVSITNPSPIVTTWQVSDDAPWLQVSPTNGASSWTGAGGFTISASAASLTSGTYTARITVESTTEHIVLARPISVTLEVVESRFVTIESPTSGSVAQPLVVRGWAIDTGTSTGTGVTAVDIQAIPQIGPAVFLGTATYGGSRPAVGTARGARFANSGFQLTYTGTLFGGTYRIVAFARSASGARWTKPAGEVTVAITGPARTFGDFNGDGRPDLLWQHRGSGSLAAWMLNGTVMISGQVPNPGGVSDANWRVVGLGDFNGDSRVDMLWQHQVNGNLAAWFLNGTNLIGSAALAQTVGDPNWRVVSVKDFDRDGKPDLLWQHQVNGGLVVWLMDGVNFTRGVSLTPISLGDPNWRVVGVNDFDRDGHVDLLWRHLVTGGLVVWLMDGLTTREGQPLSPTHVADGNWRVAATADFDSDGNADLLWQHATTGGILVWFMDGLSFTRSEWLTPSAVGDTNWRIVAAY
jgi:hypothetical protein